MCMPIYASDILYIWFEVDKISQLVHENRCLEWTRIHVTHDPLIDVCRNGVDIMVGPPLIQFLAQCLDEDRALLRVPATLISWQPFEWKEKYTCLCSLKIQVVQVIILNIMHRKYIVIYYLLWLNGRQNTMNDLDAESHCIPKDPRHHHHLCLNSHHPWWVGCRQKAALSVGNGGKWRTLDRTPR